MNPPRQALLMIKEQRVRKTLTQLLRISQFEITVIPMASRIGDVNEKQQFEIIVFDDSFLAEADTERFQMVIKNARDRRARVLCINEQDSRGHVISLFRKFGITNLIAKNSQTDLNDLVITANKLVKNSIFGLEKYLPWGSEVIVRTLYSSDRKDLLLRELEAFGDSVGCNKALIKHFAAAADEMLMNAIYDAPCDQSKVHKYRHTARTERIELGAGEEVTLKYGSDGKHLVVSVSDNFGSVDWQTIILYLERCFAFDRDQIEEKKGGAGLGLFMTFESVSSFVVNIDPGNRSEFIAFIDITGSLRDFVAMKKSLHIFTTSTELMPLPNEGDAPTEIAKSKTP